MASRNGSTRSDHIVWDWNGTLLHDIDVVVEATNVSFAEIGIPPITLERYRELYCVPVPRFYERLIGRLPTDEEWAVMDSTFHRHYFARADSAALAEGAAALLADWQEAGRTQSVCSLAPHERLLPWVTRLGIHSHFLRVDGNVTDGVVTGKAEQMARHLAALSALPSGLDPGRVVVIGDATDDAAAAAHAGAKAVLYTGGSHSRRSLLAAGVPVVDTLDEAVRTAEELLARM
ncbi:HAD family hydrolase [Streptomyces radicis]|uniref:HAD family hydrolase n=1 Tax=Streptomyces radicis TaxID=1750517 RepID=A0A3A9W4L2_9ACTN|nr:HAD family hydrolase [Streptomyces radicis]RKN07790.1 HAD family hydrolase [Streptomyces radicis]RKN20754.1 HAD family hydrolase [Streptomyces radicis]